MCGGIKYIDQANKEWKIYFPSPKAALPIITNENTIEWIKWGRRKEEQVPFVQGGWARSDSIAAGKWDRLEPTKVRLAAISFMEKDAERVSHWIDVSANHSIEALVIENNSDKRIYIITDDTPPEYKWVHDRWPKIIPI